MKLLIKLSIIFLVLFSFISCDKEIEIETSFPFESEAFGETKSLLSNTLTTTLRLSPERRIQDTEYFFSYDSSEKGFYTVRGVPLAERQEFKFGNKELTEELVYTPKVAGTHNVNFDFRDSNGNTSESSIKYEITEGNTIDFKIDTEDKEINIDEKAVLNASIEVMENGIVPQDLSFEMLYQNTDSQGSITINNISYLPGDTISDLKASNFIIQYIPVATGDASTLTFTLTASNGKKFVQETSIKVNSTEFDFEFTPAVNEAVLNERAQISLNITQTSNEALIYSVEISGQEGLLFDDFIGNQNLPVTLSSITKGNRSLRFTPQLVGTSEFIIKVTASNGDSKTKRVSFTTKPIDFDFEFTPVVSEIVLSMPVQVSLAITQPSGEALAYSIEISGQQGLLFDDSVGNQRLPVMLNNITPGDRSLRFTPQLVGTSEFIIKVTSSNGDSKTKRVSFTTKPVDFDFEFSPPIIQLRNGGIGVGTDLTESVSFTLDRPRILGLDISYTMRVLSEVGSFTIRNINGTHSPGNVIQLPENTTISNNVVSGQFEFPRTINSSGTITVIVANSTGFEVRKTINVEVITN